MDQTHSSPTHPARTTQDPRLEEVVPGYKRVESPEWVLPPGADQAQPTCFGVGQLRVPERSENDRLCSACMNLDRIDNTYWEGINNFRKVIVDHHHSFAAFFESARGGCHLCVLLLAAWEEKCRLEKDPDAGWVGKLGVDSASLTGGIRLEFQRVKSTQPMTFAIIDEIHITILCETLPYEVGGQLICKVIDDDHLALSKTCLPSSEDINTGSSASLYRIKAWLDICLSSHPACAQAGLHPPPLPTRVVAVGGKGSSRCYLVSGNNKNGYYASLSHCWGDPRNRPLSTTDRTLSRRQRGIEDENLPKTFRHAVQVCRELGIEYIWIDSLCIIQEQETQEDWAKEAPRMGQVYGNSILNISAAAAADSTQGCFRKRLGLNNWPCPMVLFGQACYLFRYPTRKEENVGDPGDAHTDRSNVLARRGWVLQEQILSRRSIIFSNNRLIWRCPTLATNEKYPLGIPHAPNVSFDTHRLLYCTLNGITSSVPKELTVDNYACWYRIVEEFTHRDLTYKEDRLPAIAGIAKRFGEAVIDSYHAGLWRHDMILGLLWRNRDINATWTAKSAKLPSWSWASINCRVTYSGLLSLLGDARRICLSPLIDILDVSDPITCEDHPFGITSRASLSLSGVLMTVVQVKHEDCGLALIENGTRIAEIEDFSRDIKGIEGLDPAPLVCLPTGVNHHPYHHRMRDDGELYKDLWKKSLETGIDEFEGYHRLFCLILQAVEGNQDTYRRVGLCTVSIDETMKIGRMAFFGERRYITLV